MSPRSTLLVQVGVLCFIPLTASAAAPPGYWSATEGLTGDALRAAIHDTIDDQLVIPYSSTGFDVHDAIDILDEDPADPSSVRLIYSDATAPKSSWPGYNREHLWPQSLGATEGTPAHTDLHHIFSCDQNVNSTRQNLPFGECDDDCDSHPEAPDALYNHSVWEPPDRDKGDIARAILYMDVRYEGGAEQDLVLGSIDVETSCDCMGDLGTLLAWHALDPVDDAERARHEGVYDLQGNRNPFIDRPEWACALWPAGCDEPYDPGPGDGVDEPLPADVGPFINEIHYDNLDADQGEGLEIVGAAGMSLDGWSLTLYNGSGMVPYGSVALGGSIPDEGEGAGALWFPIGGLQNGPSDGVALIAPHGEVVEFLAWEGPLTAAGGPAEGMTAEPIGVVEEGFTPIGHSLQRVGDGRAPADFQWVGPRQGSPGRINEGQRVALVDATPTQPPTPTLTPTPFPTPTPTAGTPTPEPLPDGPGPADCAVAPRGAPAAPAWLLLAFMLARLVPRRRRADR